MLFSVNKKKGTDLCGTPKQRVYRSHLASVAAIKNE